MILVVCKVMVAIATAPTAPSGPSEITPLWLKPRTVIIGHTETVSKLVKRSAPLYSEVIRRKLTVDDEKDKGNNVNGKKVGENDEIQQELEELEKETVPVESVKEVKQEIIDVEDEMEDEEEIVEEELEELEEEEEEDEKEEMKSTRDTTAIVLSSNEQAVKIAIFDGIVFFDKSEFKTWKLFNEVEEVRATLGDVKVVVVTANPLTGNIASTDASPICDDAFINEALVIARELLINPKEYKQLKKRNLEKHCELKEDFEGANYCPNYDEIEADGGTEYVKVYNTPKPDKPEPNSPLEAEAVAIASEVDSETGQIVAAAEASEVILDAFGFENQIPTEISVKQSSVTEFEVEQKGVSGKEVNILNSMLGGEIMHPISERISRRNVGKRSTEESMNLAERGNDISKSFLLLTLFNTQIKLLLGTKKEKDALMFVVKMAIGEAEPFLLATRKFGEDAAKAIKRVIATIEITERILKFINITVGLFRNGVDFEFLNDLAEGFKSINQNVGGMNKDFENAILEAKEEIKNAKDANQETLNKIYSKFETFSERISESIKAAETLYLGFKGFYETSMKIYNVFKGKAENESMKAEWEFTQMDKQSREPDDESRDIFNYAFITNGISSITHTMDVISSGFINDIVVIVQETPKLVDTGKSIKPKYWHDQYNEMEKEIEDLKKKYRNNEKPPEYGRHIVDAINILIKLISADGPEILGLAEKLRETLSYINLKKAIAPLFRMDGIKGQIVNEFLKNVLSVEAAIMLLNLRNDYPLGSVATPIGPILITATIAFQVNLYFGISVSLNDFGMFVAPEGVVNFYVTAGYNFVVGEIGAGVGVELGLKMPFSLGVVYGVKGIVVKGELIFWAKGEIFLYYKVSETSSTTKCATVGSGWWAVTICAKIPKIQLSLPKYITSIGIGVKENFVMFETKLLD